MGLRNRAELAAVSAGASEEAAAAAVEVLWSDSWWREDVSKIGETYLPKWEHDPGAGVLTATIICTWDVYSKEDAARIMREHALMRILPEEPNGDD